MTATMKANTDGFYPSRTTSRRLGKGTKTRSQTKGKEKGGNCAKSELKTWGATANPYKLSGGDVGKYQKYCAMTSGINR